MLHLPYKPFTLDEVKDITGSKLLDTWVAIMGGASIGDDQVTIGLSYMQAFAVHVGERWLHEGADTARTASVVRYVAGLDFTHMEQEFRNGRSFPCPRSMMDPDLLKRMKPSATGILVRPPEGRIGKALNLCTLHTEFRALLSRVFPNDPKLQ